MISFFPRGLYIRRSKSHCFCHLPGTLPGVRLSSSLARVTKLAFFSDSAQALNHTLPGRSRALFSWTFLESLSHKSTCPFIFQKPFPPFDYTPKDPTSLRIVSLYPCGYRLEAHVHVPMIGKGCWVCVTAYSCRVGGERGPASLIGGKDGVCEGWSKYKVAL